MGRRSRGGGGGGEDEEDYGGEKVHGLGLWWLGMSHEQCGVVREVKFKVGKFLMVVGVCFFGVQRRRGRFIMMSFTRSGLCNCVCLERRSANCSSFQFQILVFLTSLQTVIPQLYRNQEMPHDLYKQTA